MQKHWLQQFAENYMGGGDVDQFHVQDGTEELDSALQDPKNNGGVYQDNEYYPATMPYSLDVHDSQNSQAEKDKPNPSRSDEYSEMPFGQQGVDDNHADSVASLNLQEDDVAGAGANFMHNAPDSPKILEDGYPLEELQEGMGVNDVFNNTVNKARPTDGVLLEDPGIVERDPNRIDDTPDINKGRALMSSRLNPFARSIREIQADAWTDDSGSNVEDVEYPDEIDRKHRRSTEDFGTKDQMGDGNTAATMPAKGYSGDDYDSMLYSIQPMGADETLKNYLQKIAAGLKKADFTQVMPSANPNSGPDDDLDDVSDLLSYTQQPSKMLDGKTNGTNMNDKDESQFDMNYNRKKRIYPNRTEDTDDYFSTENTGGGFGNEGDPTKGQSGVVMGD